MVTERMSAGKAPRHGHAPAQAPMQRFATPRAFAGEMEAPQVHPGVLRPSAGGAPLPGAVRAKMEAAFGHDFRGVRVHQGGEAESIGAAAYARGTHLHFAAGRYQPHSEAGQRLIGHELAHIVQQRARRVAHPGGAVPVNDSPALEREADAAGARAATGQNTELPGAVPLQAKPLAPGGAGPVQRQLDDDEKPGVLKGMGQAVNSASTLMNISGNYVLGRTLPYRVPNQLGRLIGLKNALSVAGQGTGNAMSGDHRTAFMDFAQSYADARFSMSGSRRFLHAGTLARGAKGINELASGKPDQAMLSFLAMGGNHLAASTRNPRLALAGLAADGVANYFKLALGMRGNRKESTA